MNIKRKKGMSIIDAIVAIAIFTFGMQAFVLVFVKVWNSNSFILEEGEASMAASRVVNEIIKEIRKTKQADNGDYPIESGDSFNLTVFLDVDNDNVTERVHYFLEDESIKVGITEPEGTPPIYPAGDQTIKTMASYIINDYLSQPIFYYYNSDYPGDEENNPLAVPIYPEQVRLVRIHLYVNIKPDKAPDHINIESVAELRNLNDYNDF